MHETHYLAFGLRIASQLALPDLPRAEQTVAAPADVQIRIGAVATCLDRGKIVTPGVIAAEGALLLDYPAGRYLIRDGRKIVIQPAPGSSERDVLGYLLGSAMGAICHQRGLLPLHANAIEVGGRAVAFAGPSGAGKSTLAAYFAERGHKVLCDDLCVLSFGADGAPIAWPGVPRIKLWSDTLAAFGRDAAALERVFDGEDKFILPTPPDPRPRPVPLGRIYVLRDPAEGHSPAMERMWGAEAFSAILANVYRWEFAAHLGRSTAQFANVLSVLKSTAVYSARRRWGFDVFSAQGERLERHIDQYDPPSAGDVHDRVSHR